MTPLKKLKLLVFAKRENLTKVKVKKPTLFAQATMLYACAKRVASKLGFKPKKKGKPEKTKKIKVKN